MCTLHSMYSSVDGDSTSGCSDTRGLCELLCMVFLVIQS